MLMVGLSLVVVVVACGTNLSSCLITSPVQLSHLVRPWIDPRVRVLTPRRSPHPGILRMEEGPSRATPNSKPHPAMLVSS